MSVDFYRSKKPPTATQKASFLPGGAHVDVTEELLRDCVLQAGLKRFAKQMMKSYQTYTCGGEKLAIVGLTVNNIGVSFILGDPVPKTKKKGK